MAAMKMRQSLDELEAEFRQSVELHRTRDEILRRQALQRTRKRRIERRQKKGTLRFWMLCLSIVLTAVVVTVAMFESLALLLG
jgi:anti-sigma-K factor RskA